MYILGKVTVQWGMYILGKVMQNMHYSKCSSSLEAIAYYFIVVRRYT
jgi:hypothetical protein